MELIDKEAFIKRIEKQREHLRPHIYEHDVIGDAAYTVVVGIAEQFPTVDAVPVVHGHWIKHPRAEYEDYDVCSACKTNFKVRTKYIHNGSANVRLDKFAYCPRCGAKMDEERKDDDEQRND